MSTKAFSFKKPGTRSVPVSKLEISSPSLIHADALFRTDLLPIEHVNNNADLEAARRERRATMQQQQQQPNQIYITPSRFSFNGHDEAAGISVPPHARISWAPGDGRVNQWERQRPSLRRKPSVWNRISGLFRGRQQFINAVDSRHRHNSNVQFSDDGGGESLQSDSTPSLFMVGGKDEVKPGGRVIISHRQTPPTVVDDDGDDNSSRSSFLHVDIPRAEMERYSIMFGDILDYSKRQSFFPRVSSLPEEDPEEVRILADPHLEIIDVTILTPRTVFRHAHLHVA